MDQSSPHEQQVQLSHMNPQSSYITSDSRQQSRGMALKVVFALFVGMPAVLFWITVSLLFLGLMSLFAEEEVYCNVARVPLHGIVTTTDDGFMQLLGYGALTSADSFIEQVRNAEKDEHIDAILIDINSPGGTPVAADEMMGALVAAEKPVVAVVRDLGASAAYWVAAGADHIIASPVSDVGSIGVTMSYLETASSTEIEGSRWVNLSSGAFKDAGHPERILREEEEQHFRAQVDSVHDFMVERIAGARNAMSVEEVRALADGRAYVGVEALGLKLVDELGSYRAAQTWLAHEVSTSKEDMVLCPLPDAGWSELF